MLKGFIRLDESFVVVKIKERTGVKPILISKDFNDIFIRPLSSGALGLLIDHTIGELEETRRLLLNLS
ncbi:MAG: hypothetical protein QXX95_07165 [Nitrososphaerales archaeon]